MGGNYRYAAPLRSYEYTLASDGVEVTSRRYGKTTRARVGYEAIPMHSTLVTTASKSLGWATLVFALLFVILSFATFNSDGPRDYSPMYVYSGLCIACGVAYVLTRSTAEVYMHEGDHITFYRRAKEDPRLKEFIQEMQQKKIAFLKQRIARRAAEIAPEELSRYVLYLRESDLVNDAGYEELKDHLDNLNAQRSRIGFDKESH